MLLRGYTPENTNKNPNYKNQHRKSYNSVDKRYSYNPRYEPIRGSDIFCELPPKYDKYVPEYEIRRKYEIYYNKKQNEENYEKNINNKNRNKNKSYNKINNKVYDINKEKYEYNPYKTTYKSSFIPIKINENILVGNDKMLGTGVAYNSRKQKIEFLKSNIFCDKDKYNQNTNLKDNFNPKNINHNNWYTNLDWRNNKSELIFYKNNQKEFYDNNSKANYNCFTKYK
jgi:hypothetical protein